MELLWGQVSRSWTPWPPRPAGRGRRRSYLAEGDERLRRRVLPLLTELTRSGTPAMRSRGHKLLARLRRADR